MSLPRLILCVSALSLVAQHQASSETIQLEDGGYGRIALGDIYHPYSDNINKTWIIKVRPGYRVKLTFTAFDLEDSYDENAGGACVYDYVQIDGDRRFCGNPEKFPYDAPRIGKPYVSKSNIMKIHFVSDYANDSPKPIGFEAHYIEEDADECLELKEAINRGGEGWEELLYCNHFCNNVPGTYYCSCRHGFTLNKNKHTCVANCEKEVTANPDGGFISSKDYLSLSKKHKATCSKGCSGSYSKLMDCETTLSAGTGRRLDVRFDAEFGIEEHYEEGCVYDWLKLSANGNVTTYCGNVAPNNGSWIILDAGNINITFHSDLSNEEQGYKMYYRTYLVKCREVVRAPSNGIISNSPTKTEFEFGDRIEFSCNLGYRMRGAGEMLCEEDGTWSNLPPTCHIKHCPRPDDLLNVSRTKPPSFDETERPYGSSITIPCINKWYELVSGTTVWTCGDDEEWHEGMPPIFPNAKNNTPECRPYCGIKNARGKHDFFKGLIYGGRNARDGEWPWMAFLDLGGGLRGGEFCGASLVDEQYIVTAAHCVSGIHSSYIKVHLGVTDRFNRSNPHIQNFTVKAIEIHENYTNNPNSLLDHDIAVLKLDRPAVIGRYVRPICIPRSNMEKNLPVQSPKRGVVAGWGITELNKPAEVLKLVRVPYFDRARCVEVYNNQSRDHQAYSSVSITNNHFCAGFLNKAKDSCKGDSGGPLMWNDRATKKWFLNGIVSFGTQLGGCSFYVVGVYTKVANYVNFLDSIVILTP